MRLDGKVVPKKQRVESRRDEESDKNTLHTREVGDRAVYDSGGEIVEQVLAPNRACKAARLPHPNNPMVGQRKCADRNLPGMTRVQKLVGIQVRQVRVHMVVQMSRLERDVRNRGWK